MSNNKKNENRKMVRLSDGVVKLLEEKKGMEFGPTITFNAFVELLCWRYATGRLAEVHYPTSVEVSTRTIDVANVQSRVKPEKLGVVNDK